MNFDMTLSSADLIALVVFAISWLGFNFVLSGSLIARPSLTMLMARQRREWMLVMADRDLRMIDTTVLGGLLQGSAFFGSTCILAIGGCFALLGSTETVLQVVGDLPVDTGTTRQAFELKVFGLTVIFVYAFFKFGWAYRLFNYCGILIAAVPHPEHAAADVRKTKALRAADMNIIASRHFTSGMRAIFFALGYLGWFLGAAAFLASTLFVLAVLVRRQYFSRARAVIDEEIVSSIPPIKH